MAKKNVIAFSLRGQTTIDGIRKSKVFFPPFQCANSIRSYHSMVMINQMVEAMIIGSIRCQRSFWKSVSRIRFYEIDGANFRLIIWTIHLTR